MKNFNERKAILDNEIKRQQKKGWRVIDRTDTTCTLESDKNPDTCLVIFLLLLFIIPLILYLIFRRKTTTVFVEVKENGEIVYNSKDLTPHQLEEANKQANSVASSVVDTKPTDQQTNELGLLTVENIADGLKITEDEVMELINSSQLKSKKIGDKYFVRKDDFDEFMKK